MKLKKLISDLASWWIASFHGVVSTDKVAYRLPLAVGHTLILKRNDWGMKSFLSKVNLVGTDMQEAVYRLFME